MYLISFALPIMKDSWGFTAFRVYLEAIANFDQEDYLFVLAVNLSNAVMISSPLLFSRRSPQTLGALVFAGGLINTRFLWMEESGNLWELFPAYYVWWLSFFVTGVALWRTPAAKV